MKVTITNQYLIFHDTQNEEVVEYIKKNELESTIFRGKLHVKASKDKLYMMLWHLTNDNDIDLI